MNSLSGKRLLHKDGDRYLESNERIQEEFPNESGLDTVPQEMQDDHEEVLLTEEGAGVMDDRKRELIDESRLFTFKKECPTIPKSATIKTHGVKFLDDEEYPNPFSSDSENIQATNESLEYEEPQIYIGNQPAVSKAEERATGCPQKQPKTTRNSQRKVDCNFLSITPRSTSKHTLNDSIEPKIALDRVHIPRKSPLKHHFPENPSGLKSANTSQYSTVPQ